MIAYLFPGQGSQVKGMGANLFAEFPDLINAANAILGYSIEKLCLEDSEQQLHQTAFTQPALYVVNTLNYLQKNRSNKAKPDFVAGHSLGEYNALFAAEVFDFVTGLKLVKKRGELMQNNNNGKMAAIIGFTIEEVRAILKNHFTENLFIANYNSLQQIVISGDAAAIDSAQQLFTAKPSSSFIPLQVSGAFHSPYMLTAQQQFADYLQPLKFNTPTIPVIANINAHPYHPAIIKENLISQISQTVCWVDSMHYLIHQGVKDFEEIGQNTVLTNLLARIRLHK